MVHPSFPAKTVQEFIAYAKANPGKVSYGSAGIGTVSHVCGEYFASATGIKLVHIPYKGTGPALSDLIGGHIPVAFAPIPATYENSKSGTMRMLAVTSLERSTLAPEMPTIAEQGVPGFEAVLRYALVAPAGVPRPIIEKLNKALNAALATDEVRKRLALEGAEPVPSTPGGIRRRPRQGGDAVGQGGEGFRGEGGLGSIAMPRSVSALARDAGADRRSRCRRTRRATIRTSRSRW